MTSGPNFDYTYYVTVTGVGGCIVNVFAIMLYLKFLRSWRYWPVLISIKFICAISSMIDLIIVMCWNIAIGIPDEAIFLLLILRKLSKGLLAIPMSSIYAKVAPPGMESSVFGELSLLKIEICSITRCLNHRFILCLSIHYRNR
jgi:hypothetical protein